MSFFPKRAHYIGIDLEKSTLKIAAIRPTKKGWVVTQLKDLSIHQAVNSLDTFPQHAQVVTALDAKETFVKFLELPLKKDKEIRSALELQANSLLPFPADQAILDAQFHGVFDKKTHLNLLAIKKIYIEKHLENLKACHLHTQITTSVPLALAALSSLLVGKEAPQLLVHVGEHEARCALVSNGFLLKSYALNLSQTISKEIRKVILSLSQEGKNYNFDTIVLLGHVTEDLRLEVQEVCKKTTVFPSSSELVLSQEKITHYGLAIGIALAGTKKINFLKKEFTPPLNMKLLRKPLMFFGVGVMVLTLLLGALNIISLKRQKHSIQEQFQSLAMQENKKDLHPKTWIEYQNALQQLRKEIDSHPDTFPLLPQLPTVSELLSWLLNHPLLAKTKDVEIQLIHYSLVKHPDLAHPQDRYQAKVTLEVTTKTPQLAKLLHETLEQESSYIDHKQDLQWSTSKDGTHHISFCLKDKTRYS